MGDTDGEYQERHQHRIGIETKAQGMQQTELPDHRDQRGDQYRQGALNAVGEPQQQHEGDANGHGKEQRHTDQTINEITDLLGEADDMHLDVGILRLVLLTNLVFKLMRELLVVQLDQLALIIRVRVGLEQRNIDDAGLEVVRH